MGRSRVLNIENLQQFTAINILSDPGHIGGPVIVPNCVQVILRWTLINGKTATNVLYGRAAGTPNPTAAQADAIFTALGTGAQWTALAALMAPGSLFAGVSLRSVHSAGLPFVPSTGAAKPGTDGTGATLPNEVAAALTLRTALVGPSNRGRIYIPSLTATAIGAGNTISAAAVTALTNWGGTIGAALSAQGYTHVIGQPARQAYTGITGAQHPARAASSVPVTSVTCRNNTWDSQRRRGLK